MSAENEIECAVDLTVQWGEQSRVYNCKSIDICYKETLSSNLHIIRDSARQLCVSSISKTMFMSDKTHFANLHFAIWQRSSNTEHCPFPTFSTSDVPEGLAVICASTCMYTCPCKPADLITHTHAWEWHKAPREKWTLESYLGKLS